jgi:hypothetical protein
MLPHIFPFFKGFGQSFYTHPASHPVEDLEHLIRFDFSQFTFHHLKRSDGIIDEHEEHIPISPIGNAFRALGLYVGMYLCHRVNSMQGSFLFREDNCPGIGNS